MAKVQPFEKGSRVRLRHDITTRGGVKFKAGVVMRVMYYETRMIDLRVVVRAKYHGLRLEKKNLAYYLEPADADPANQKEKS